MELNSSNVLSLHNFMFSCFHSAAGACHMASFTIFNVLLVPVYIFILYLGQQRWRQQRSTTMSYSDCITYHAAILELMSIVGSIVCCCGIYTNLLLVTQLGFALFPLKLTGHMMFNILTCVERYLAVVHPVTYLSLRTENGIRVRNIVTGCIWGLSVTSIGTLFILDEITMIILSSLTLSTCVLLICFFSISVLCVLIRPKPGEGTSDRQQVNQSKLRAFYIIMLVLGLLLLRSGGNFLAIVKVDSLHLEENERCGIWFSVFWFCLPSTLLLPLMFLQKAGKLSFCKQKIKSDQTSH